MGPQGGTVTAMSAYVGPVDPAPYNQYQLAIYTDSNGTPGTLVAQSASGTLTPNSWNTLPLSASLQAGATYWLMYNTNAQTSGSNNLAYTTTTQGEEAYIGEPFGTWPSSFPPAHFYTYQFSLYATLSLDAATTSTSSTRSMAAGWNLLDVPAQNTGITSMASLASSLDRVLGAGATQMVTTYTGGRFSLYVPGYTADHQLAPWQGIMVLSRSAGSWQVTGNTYTSGILVPLAPGWNLIAAPYPSPSLGTSTIASEASGCHVQEIALYGAGTYQTWQPGQATMSIPSTSGMWVQCTRSQSWTPS
jgi:hypothetical protein